MTLIFHRLFMLLRSTSADPVTPRCRAYQQPAQFTNNIVSQRLPQLLTVMLLGLVAGPLLFGGTTYAQVIPDLRAKARSEFGPAAEQTVKNWERLIIHGRNQSLEEQLQLANRFFNERVRWVSDEEIWGTEDYWATPLETMGKARGDCEDFSIAKYATLLLMGVDPESLRLIYVKAKRGGLTQAHMVLAWYASATTPPLILDNIDFTILPANERGDLFPVFSFNAQALWVGNKTAPSSANPINRLSRWRSVLSKMRDEGFDLGI